MSTSESAAEIAQAVHESTLDAMAVVFEGIELARYELDRLIAKNESLSRLREELTRYAKLAAAEPDSPERSQARRLLRTISGAAAERVDDADYRALLDRIAWRGRQP